MSNKLCTVLLVLLIITGCAHTKRLHQTCKDSDKSCLIKAAKNHIIKDMSFWEKYLAMPLDERVLDAPQEIIDYVLLQNRLQNFSEKPKAVSHDAAFVSDFKSALKELPDSVKKQMQKKLLAIFLAQDTGGSAITEIIRKPDGTPLGGVIVFDQDKLQKKANEWATWKEASVYKKHADWKLVLEIATQKHNNRKNAISFILLHELGHVVSINENFHPSWDGVSDPQIDSFPYTQLSWPHFTSFQVPQYSSRFDADVFTLRRNLAFYSGGTIESQDMESVYNQLEQTNFITLYGATNPGDDFAEGFASYVHHVLLKRPYQVNIFYKGKLKKSFKLCWQEKRCLAKKEILEKFLVENK